MKKMAADMQAAFGCFCSFLGSTLLFAASWKVVEALRFVPGKMAAWIFVVLPACCFVLGACALKLFPRARRDAPHAEKVVTSQVVFPLLVLAVSMASFAHIAGTNHELIVMRQGLEDSAAPGWASINCTEEGIDVRTDRFTYFALAPKDWRVASEKAS
eukprot:Rhum_TRINITY_DN15904_c0_g1::Rhum_TRINITY_DN15904_c0_g1_i1::g.162407::m.162407